MYNRLDEAEHNQPPAHYKAVAKELRKWGLHVDVDGRAACPDCSLDAKNFKLSETPARCRIKPGVDLSTEPYICFRPIKPEWDMFIIQICARGDERVGYDVRYIVPESWISVDDKYGEYGRFKVYDRPGGTEVAQVSAREVAMVEPGEVKSVQNGNHSMKFFSVKGLLSGVSFHVKTNMVDVVERKRASGLSDIPDTFFIFENFRFPVDEELADQMLTLVQGYTVTVSGRCRDCSPIQAAIPRLRNILVDLRIPKGRSHLHGIQ